MTTNLYLIRHARTTWNAERRIQGRTDTPLDNMGRMQAEALREFLASEKIHAFYSSPLKRALDTARIVAEPHCKGCVTINTDKRLAERDLGDIEGKTWSQIRYKHGDWAAKAEAEGWQKHTPPGGEPQQQVRDRMVAAMDKIVEKHPNQCVAVVSHSGALNAYLAHLTGAPVEGRAYFRFRNTAFIQVKLEGDRVYVFNIGKADHLVSCELDG